MKIPTYDQKVVPEGQGEVFSLPGERSTPMQIPDTAVAVQQARGKYYDVLFDIGMKIDAAKDADAAAEAQKVANQEYARIREIFENPENQMPEIYDEQGNKRPNPNYLSPEKYRDVYETESRYVRDKILGDFTGRPRAKKVVARWLDEKHDSEGVRVNSMQRQKVVADLTDRLYKRMDDRLEAMSVAYNQGDKEAVVELMKQTDADLVSAVKSGLITPAGAAALKRSVETQAIDAVMKTDINRAFNHGLKFRNTNQLDEIIDQLDKPSKDDTMTENQRIDYKIMAERMKVGLEGQIEKLNREEAEAFLAQEEQNLENAMVEYNGNTRTVTGVKSYIDGFSKKVDNMVARGVWTEARGESVKKDFQHRAVYGVELSNIYLAYQAGLDKNNPRDGIENLNDLIKRYETPSKTDLMTENQRVDLLFKAQAYKNKLENEQSERDLLAQAKVNDKIEDNIANMKREGVVVHDEEALTTEVYDAFGNENKRSDAIMYNYGVAKENARVTHQVDEEIKDKPIDLLNAPEFVNETLKKFNRPGEREIAEPALISAINAKTKALTTDPVSYVVNNVDTVKKAKERLEATPTDETKNIPASTLHQDYLKTLKQAQIDQGVPEENIRVMDNTAAASMVHLFETGEAKDIMTQADNLSNIYTGKNYDIAYRDLQRAKLPDGLQIVLSTTRREDRPLRIQAAEAYKMSDKEFDIDRDAKEDMDEALRDNSTMKKFRRSIIAQGGGSAEAQRRVNTLEASIRKLGMYRAVNAGDTDNVRLHVEKAVEDVIGAHYQFSTEGYRVPKDIPIENVEVKTESIARYFPMELLNENYPYPKELRDKISSRGFWVNDQNDTGINLVVDGVKIIDKDNNPIYLPFDNLNKYDDVITEGNIVVIGNTVVDLSGLEEQL